MTTKPTNIAQHFTQAMGIIVRTARSLGIPHGDIIGPARTHRATRARGLVIHHLRSNLGWSTNSVAKLLNRTPEHVRLAHHKIRKMYVPRPRGRRAILTR